MRLDALRGSFRDRIKPIASHVVDAYQRDVWPAKLTHDEEARRIGLEAHRQATAWVCEHGRQHSDEADVFERLNAENNASYTAVIVTWLEACGFDEQWLWLGWYGQWRWEPGARLTIGSMLLEPVFKPQPYNPAEETAAEAEKRIRAEINAWCKGKVLVFQPQGPGAPDPLVPPVRLRRSLDELTPIFDAIIDRRSNRVGWKRLARKYDCHRDPLRRDIERIEAVLTSPPK